MSSPRFFCPLELSEDATIDLPEETARHAGRSLRLREGDEIVLFNGQGGEYQARLHFEEGQAQAELIAFRPEDNLPQVHIELIQALPQSDKLDWIIEKCSEIGVRRITPISSARSVLKLEGNRLEKRLSRWRKIGISAAEQCGRNVPLQVMPLSSVSDLAKTCDQQSAAGKAADAIHYLLCEPEAELSLAGFLKQGLQDKRITSASKFSLLIGPEGGWSSDELEQLKQIATPVRWGDLVLRTETAGLVLAASLITSLME